MSRYERLCEDSEKAWQTCQAYVAEYRELAEAFCDGCAAFLGAPRDSVRLAHDEVGPLGRDLSWPFALEVVLPRKTVSVAVGIKRTDGRHLLHLDFGNTRYTLKAARPWESPDLAPAYELIFEFLKNRCTEIGEP